MSDARRRIHATDAPPTEPIDLDELTVRTRRLDSGRSLEVESLEDGSDHVVVRGVDGLVELEVTFSDRGPLLRFQAAEMRLEAKGKLALRGAELDMRAEGGITQQAGGNLTQRIDGDAEVQIRGDLQQRARVTTIQSYRGDVRIEANDDVVAVGERVRLNP